MRAVLVDQYGAIDKMRIGEIATPAVAAGHVLVKVQAAGIGFVEGLKVQGRYQIKDPLPFTPGMDFAGTIESLADDVHGLAVGMRVMGSVKNGALAQYLCAHPSKLYSMPPALTAEAGASFYINYLTALYALQARAFLKPAEKLLVLGAAGGTGLAAIQVAKLMGAEVIAAASTPQKRQAATNAGADATIDYTDENWRENLKQETKGNGPDVIFDPVGGAVADQAFRSIAWNGRYVVVGFASGEIPSLKFNLPLLKGGMLVGVDAAQIEQKEPQVYRAVVDRLMGWIESGALVPLVGEVFEFDDFRGAFRRLQDQAAVGKMVLRIA